MVVLVVYVSQQAGEASSALQGKTCGLAEQEDVLKQLHGKLAGAFTDEDTNVVSAQKILDNFLDLGIFANELVAEVPGVEDGLVEPLAKLLLEITSISAVRDSENKAYAVTLPPTVPRELMATRPRDFVTLLAQHRPRLLAFRTEEFVQQVDEQFRALLADPTLVIDSADFDKGWKLAGPKFPALFEFCGGLATAFPTTATVEADFSELKIKKDVHKSNLSDFSCEACWQASQYFALDALAVAQ